MANYKVSQVKLILKKCQGISPHDMPGMKKAISRDWLLPGLEEGAKKIKTFQNYLSTLVQFLLFLNDTKSVDISIMITAIALWRTKMKGKGKEEAAMLREQQKVNSR